MVGCLTLFLDFYLYNNEGKPSGYKAVYSNQMRFVLKSVMHLQYIVSTFA